MSGAENDRPKRSIFWLQGAVAAVIVLWMPGTGLVIGALLGPALAFYFMEKEPGRPVAKIMLLTGTTGVIMPLRTLWEHGNTLELAIGIVSDPAGLVLAWFACAAGWALCEGIQIAAKLALASRSKIATELLRREKEELLEEWTFPESTDSAPT